MNKLNYYVLNGAIALLSTAGFVACSSSDEVADAPVNPTFDGKSVKAAFAISLPTTVGGGTRMTENETQSNEQFQGMKNIYLFPFAKTISETVGKDDATSLNAIKLADFTSFDNATSNKKIYSDQTFEIGTSHFLFYGETKIDQPTGSLTPSYLTTMPAKAGDIKFTLSTSYKAADEPTDNAVLKALNDVYGKLSVSSETGVPALATKMKNEDPNSRGTYKAFAGSSTSVLALVEDIYNSLVALDKTAVLDDVVGTGKTFTAQKEATNLYKLSWVNDPNYPAIVGLPDGAVCAKWDEASSKFIASVSEIDGVKQADKSNYMKPAALYYYVNTPVMTDVNTHFTGTGTNDYTTSDWATVTGAGTAYQDKAVEATTRSVILKNQVNYGVALLESGVNKVTASLADQKGNLVQVTDDKTFEITGILVGGQKNVGWNFATDATDATEKTVWDGVPANSSAKVLVSENSKKNYTLLLETAGNASSESVNVCLELLNKCQDFYGRDGLLIPYGTKFYLVGQLITTSATQPSGETINQVFKQDHKTIVNFTFGNNTLGKAYNVIPDLRSPKLEFGLSVDLKWQSGLTFDVIL